jgi:hypothetical protein
MNHKNLQKEIQPQTPKIKPPKKIKDTEGLGKRIPIENIGALAANIGAAALTGGATAAGEALVMGGTAGLMGAGESILGASIGGGVAGGVSSALGNSTAGHIISGVAGGIAGRRAGTRIANRLRNRDIQNEESQSLFLSGRGQRLGGRRGRNRLVPEIQESRDSITGEIIPPEEAMSSIRRAANRTMKQVSNTVSNLKDQISDAGESIMGTIRRRGRPRSSVFPKSDDKLVEDLEGRMRWDNEMRQNELKRVAANKLTAAIKRKKEENTIGFTKIANENDRLSHILEMDKTDQMLKDYNKQFQGNFKNTRALDIQSVFRGHRARKQAKAKENKSYTQQATQISKKTLDEDAAATTISSILRGHKGRAKTARLKKFQDTIKDKTILSNIAQPTTNKRFFLDKNEEPSFKRQLVKDTTTEDTVRDVVNDMVKRIEKSNALKKLNVPKVKKGRPVLKRQYDVKFIPQQKIKEMYNELREPKISSDLQTRPSVRQEAAATKIGKVVKGHLSRKDTSRNKQMEAAKNKYDKIVERMATRNEMIFGETAPSRFIQSAARLRKKAFQSEISHVDTRANVATKQEKDARIKAANEGISRMDNIIQKKSAAGRPRTRSEQEAAAGGGSSSRLSMLSTTSTIGSFTPAKTPKNK